MTNQTKFDETKEQMLLDLLAEYEKRIHDLEREVFVIKEMSEWQIDNHPVCSEYEIRNRLPLLTWFVKLGFLTDEQAKDSLR